MLASKYLGVSEQELLLCASELNSFYRSGPPVPKEDGTVRKTEYTVDPLRKIQRRIKVKLLEVINFPDFLHGGIKGRSPDTNAEVHLKSKIVIKEDIAHFYPSVTYNSVLNIWKYFFHFSKEVSELLALFTTHNNELPQGVCTSALLGNLVFFRYVNRIENMQKKYNCFYTRYVDDITISSKEPLSKKDTKEIISIIYGMMKKEGFSPKIGKHKIDNFSNRVELLGLTVNSSHKTISKQYRKNFRSEFFQFKRSIESGAVLNDFEQKCNHLRGCNNYISSYHSIYNRYKSELVQLRKDYYKKNFQ